MVYLIAARAANGVIGRDGRIPWRIPGDLHRFRDLTLGHIVVMGRRTYEEIGRPLPGRRTILVSSSHRVETDICTTVSTLTAALEAAAGQDVYICGGERLYREALPLADVLYLTELHIPVEGDTVFPAFDPADFTETARVPGEDEIPYDFVTYRRNAMTPAQAQDWLDAIAAQKGIVLGLEPLKRLLSLLGNPQNRTPFVHIAGTNGKGSTAALVSAVLSAAGYRTGCYTSPAVFSDLEKWRINGMPMSGEEFAAIVSRLRRVRELLERAGEPLPTAFELETAAAFVFFAEQNCQIACLECGMGGAEDATNVISTTAVSVLTSVGMDHMKFLGDTLEQIAKAKAGILRTHTPCVLARQSDTVQREIEALCRASGSPLTIPDEPAVTGQDSAGITMDYKELKNLRVSLPGLFQATNAATAIEVVRVLSPRFPVTEQQLRDGLANVRWPGRFETIHRCPRVVLDGAHNPNAAARLRDTLLACPPDAPLVFLVGVLADKDFSAVGALLAPLAAEIFTVTPDNPRALDAKALADCLRQYNPNVTPKPSVTDALHDAVRAAGESGTVLAFGSLSYLRDVRDALREVLP